MKTRPVRRVEKKGVTLPFSAPPRAWALSEWSLILLRGFLGVTFLYASLQKLANPDFFNASSSISIQQQLAGSVHTSPIGGILRPLEHVATPIGWFIIVAEVAVGVGTLIGLWGRVAAVGGALLSLSLFLTVSITQTPWYTGSDIVFLFAWTPLILAGSGTRLSMDAFIARHATHGHDVGAPDLVAIPFAQVQKMCGHYNAGKCKVRRNEPCRAHGCPILEGARPSLITRGTADHIDRRAVVIGAARASVVAGVTVVSAGAAALIGRAAHASPPGSTTTTTTTTTTTEGSGSTTTTVNAPGQLIAPVSQVPVDTAATFTTPQGDPGLVVCVASGSYVAYDAICPHAGCTVMYQSSSNQIACPCHGSVFDVATGDRLSGPAPSGLTPLNITEANGNIYLT